MIANDASNKTHLFHFLQIIILNRSVKINPYTDSPSNYRKCSYIKICVLNPICRTGVALPCGAPAGLAAICCANCNVRLWRQQSSGLSRTNLSSIYPRRRDSFTFLPLAKIMVRLGPALAGGARPHRTLFFESLRGANKRADTQMGIRSFIGTPEGTRTPNPRNRNPMLYPLSHRRVL